MVTSEHVESAHRQYWMIPVEIMHQSEPGIASSGQTQTVGGKNEESVIHGKL